VPDPAGRAEWATPVARERYDLAVLSTPRAQGPAEGYEVFGNMIHSARKETCATIR